MYDTVNMVRLASFDRQEIEKRVMQTGVHITEKHWEVIDFICKYYDYH